MLLAAAAMVAAPASARADVIFTTSTSAIQQQVVTQTSVSQDLEFTRLVAALDGGSTLYDQVFAGLLGDTAVQNAILSAEAVLTAASVDPITFLGPSLLGTSASTSTFVENDFSTATSFFTETTTLGGPGCIAIGAGGGGVLLPTDPVAGCAPYSGPGQAFFVSPSTTDVNTNTVTDTTLLTHVTTTRQTLTTSTYQLLGEVTAVPEPSTLALLGGGLVALAANFRRRVRAR
jgi:PEP-CTERM motif-containing protein